MYSDKWVSEPLRDPTTVSRPAFVVPPLACDCHVHLFGRAHQYQEVHDARYTLPEGNLDQYLAVANRLSIERIVVVQPSFYGSDNSCLLSGVEALGDRSRGVVFLPERPEAALIDTLHRAGVRGLRLDFVKASAAGDGIVDIERRLHDAAVLAKSLNWHLELYSPGHVNSLLVDRLGALDVDFSVNHLGYIQADQTEEEFAQFLELSKSPHFWVKLTAPYRLGPDEQGKRADWMAPALIAALPDRIVWGSDWPHIPRGGRDTGGYLNRLQQWCPDDKLRKRILVDNPARLYQFTASETKSAASD
jgi:2-pyrone-4,6-dicarboxylate lactonase